jgi:hypothetical protein
MLRLKVLRVKTSKISILTPHPLASGSPLKTGEHKSVLNIRILPRKKLNVLRIYLKIKLKIIN